MITKETEVKQLVEWDKKHFLHPTSNPKEGATTGPSIIFSEGKGVYVKKMLSMVNNILMRCQCFGM